MRLACYQPEIAGNMGAILRCAACFGVPVDVIEPCGFVWSDARMRRAGMDYAEKVAIRHHADFAAFRVSVPKRLVLLSSKSTTSLSRFAFAPDDTLLLGRESSGVPEDVIRACDAQVRIPMTGHVRSLNLAVSGAVALYEALRQTGGLPE